MNRRERKAKERDLQKREEQVRKQEEKLRTAAIGTGKLQTIKYRLRRLPRFVIAKGVWLIGAALALLGGYVAARPHVSVEPSLSLNPVDPYTTQFTVKNESSSFDAHDIDCVCWPRRMESGNGFSVISLAPLPKVHHEIKFLASGASSTVDCPPVIGGIGRWTGRVVDAELEIEVSYRQSWWPLKVSERFPFSAVTDAQGAVHWIHITPGEEKPILPQKK